MAKKRKASLFPHDDLLTLSIVAFLALVTILVIA